MNARKYTWNGILFSHLFLRNIQEKVYALQVDITKQFWKRWSFNNFQIKASETKKMLCVTHAIEIEDLTVLNPMLP